MKCYHHPDREAVATCSVCGRGLCAECTDRHEPIMCDVCHDRQEREEEQRIQDAWNENLNRRISQLKWFYWDHFLGFGLGVVYFLIVRDTYGPNVKGLATLFLVVPFVFSFIRRFKLDGCLGFFLKYCLFCFFLLPAYPVQLVIFTLAVYRNGDYRGGRTGWRPAVVLVLRSLGMMALFFAVLVFIIDYRDILGLDVPPPAPDDFWKDVL